MAILNEAYIEYVLERFDQTDPKIQRETMALLVQKLAAAVSFKSYVHERMDQLGVPNDPDPKRTKETGCRIGSRFNYLEAKLDRLLAGGCDWDSSQQLINALSSAPIKFWTCPECVRPRVKWAGHVATCLECGKSIVH
jgi:hypothetical protein